MMAYDFKSATGRADRPREVPSRGCVVVLCAFLVAIVAFFLWASVTGEEPTAPAKSVQLQRHDSLTHTYTHDGTDTIRVYVVTDPDAGVQYVVSDHGGITPRLDRYGEPIGKMVRKTD